MLKSLVAGILTEVLLIIRSVVYSKVVQRLDVMEQLEFLGLNWIIGCGPVTVF